MRGTAVIARAGKRLSDSGPVKVVESEQTHSLRGLGEHRRRGDEREVPAQSEAEERGLSRPIVLPHWRQLTEMPISSPGQRSGPPDPVDEVADDDDERAYMPTKCATMTGNRA